MQLEILNSKKNLGGVLIMFILKKIKTKPILFMLLLIAVFTTIVSGCSLGTDTTEKVVIAYNSPPEWANWKAVHKAFEEETGIRVPPDNKNSGQTVSALVAEKANPQADTAYYGITFGVKAAEMGILESFKPQHAEEIPSELHCPDWKWFTIHMGTVAFLVNKDALNGVPVPRSWQDLLKPEYEGMVAFLDPTSAFVGYAACTAANLALGGSLDNWDSGIEYLHKLHANGAHYPKQTSYALVVKGEIPIMIGYDFNGYRMKYEDGANVEVVIPEEGSIIVPYVISLVKNGPNPENAKLFLDFVMSDKGQAAFADGFVRPIREGVMKPETAAKFLPASDYERAKPIDYAKMATAQEAFAERWLKEVITN